MDYYLLEREEIKRSLKLDLEFYENLDPFDAQLKAEWIVNTSELENMYSLDLDDDDDDLYENLICPV